MRAIALLLMLHLGAAGFTEAFAAGEPDVTVRCVGREEAAAKGANPPLSFFCNKPLQFNAEVKAPLGSRVSIYGDLFQTSVGGWSAPLSKNIALSQELPFDGRTQFIAPCTLATPPAVKRVTRMLLKMYVRVKGPADSPQPVGTVDMFVYPRLSADEWKKTFTETLTQGGLARVAVFGKQDALRHFFRREQITFDDLGADWPETPDTHSLYLADGPPPKPDQWVSPAGAHFALFLPNSPGLPGVYSAADSAGGATVKVTLPALLDPLGDDPRSQQIFLEIIRHTLNPKAPAQDSTSTWP